MLLHADALEVESGSVHERASKNLVFHFVLGSPLQLHILCCVVCRCDLFSTSQKAVVNYNLPELDILERFASLAEVVNLYYVVLFVVG